MQARRPPRCRLARNCQAISAASEGIWITDRVLANAMERYFSVSQAVMSRRQASSVPGPMEARRRLGKRQMTEAFQVHPSPPPWAFEFPMDLSKWRWEPPALGNIFRDPTRKAPSENPPPSTEHKKPPDKLFRLRSVPGSPSPTVDFTAYFGAPATAMKPPRPSATWSLPNTYQPALPVTMDIPMRKNPEPINVYDISGSDILNKDKRRERSLNWPTIIVDQSSRTSVFLEDVLSLQTVVCTLSHESVHEKFQTCTGAFSDYLRLGLLSPAEAQVAIVYLAQALQSYADVCTKPQKARRLAIHVYSALIRSVVGNQALLLELEAGSLDGFWGPILEGIGRMATKELVTPYVLLRQVMMTSGIKQTAHVSAILKKLAASWVEESETRNAVTMKRNEISSYWKLRLSSVAVRKNPGRQDPLAMTALVETCCQEFDFYLARMSALTTDGSVASSLKLVEDASRSLQASERALNYARVGLLSCVDQLRAWMLANSIREFDNATVDKLVQASEKAICARAETCPQGTRIALHGWLAALSHMPQIRQKYLLQAADRVGKLGCGLPTAELYMLLLNKWYSQRKLTNTAVALIEKRMRQSTGDSSVGHLLEAVAYVEKVAPHSLRAPLTVFYTSIWTTARVAGDEKHIIPALERLRKKGRALRDSCLNTLAHIVSTGHRPEATLGDDMRGLILAADELQASKARQAPTPSERDIIRRMAESHRPGDIFAGLGVPLGGRQSEWVERSMRMRRDHRFQISSRKAALIAECSVVLSNPSHPRSTAAFRYVNHCVLILLRDGRHREELALAIQSLFRVATRNLHQGLKANPGRLTWVTWLVAHLEGSDSGEKVRQALLRWMSYNDHNWREFNKTATSSHCVVADG
ncbi:hypothetical protein PpBr36_01143 [Pyricularia pennisetigena]|uniref:hypothetical protein n=1 Tax=Pyricularia pennisetigena TaxID=1578925 RepID=UPI00114FE66E|nr:hypothetical protein PpBr36_01143 [Pyricularia pennisetigena]TLS28229.1 hypothetical protein PpBr36_01143 [Pyricularia pennisetigena]